MEPTSHPECHSGSIRQDVVLLGRGDVVHSATKGLLEAMGQPPSQSAQPYELSGTLTSFGPAFRLSGVYRHQPLHMAWFLAVLEAHPTLMLWDLCRQMTDEKDDLDWSLASLVVRLPSADVSQSMHWRHDHRKKAFKNPPAWNTVWDSEDSLMHALEHMLMRSVLWHEQVQPWCRQNVLDKLFSNSEVAPSELARL